MEKVFKDDLISIIVPVYNVKKYLARCVNSLCNQTYKYIEIILIDDGSTDGSHEICNEIKKMDERIKVYHKKNGGLSDARNYGIQRSNGEYITFVDGDDYVSQDYCAVLLECMKKYNSDVSIGTNIVIYDNSKVISKKSKLYGEYSKEDVFDKILYDKGIDLSACFKLYKRNLFNDIKFPVGRLYEDAATTYKLIYKAKKIAIDTRKEIYYYAVRFNSITNCEFNVKKLDLIKSTKEMTDFIKEKYPSLEKACDRRIMYSYISTLTQIAQSKCHENEIRRKLVKYVRENGYKQLKDKKVPIRDKVSIVALLINYNLFEKLWFIYITITSRKKKGK